MLDRFVFRVLVWIFLASASSWMLLSAFEKSVRIAEAFVADPGFPARYAGFLVTLVLIAGFIALAAVVISLSVSWRGTGLFRRETDGIRGEVQELRDYVGMGGEAD